MKKAKGAKGRDRPARTRGSGRASTPSRQGETSGRTTGEGPALIPQGHGGALLAGGVPGHRGAGGRPTNKARELSLRGYLKHLPRLIRIAAGTETRDALDREGNVVKIQPTFKESIEAMRELGNRAIGTKVELDQPTTPLVAAFLVGPEVARAKGVL